MHQLSKHLCSCTATPQDMNDSEFLMMMEWQYLVFHEMENNYHFQKSVALNVTITIDEIESWLNNDFVTIHGSHLNTPIFYMFL